MSPGSTVATATPANASRTTSPARSWSSQRSAFDMKLCGRRNVHASPDSRTAASDARWYAETALSSSLLRTEDADSSTTRATPASRSTASVLGIRS